MLPHDRDNRLHWQARIACRNRQPVKSRDSTHRPHVHVTRHWEHTPCKTGSQHSSVASQSRGCQRPLGQSRGMCCSSFPTTSPQQHSPATATTSAKRPTSTLWLPEAPASHGPTARGPTAVHRVRRLCRATTHTPPVCSATRAPDPRLATARPGQKPFVTTATTPPA